MRREKNEFFFWRMTNERVQKKKLKKSVNINEKKKRKRKKEKF